MGLGSLRSFFYCNGNVISQKQAVRFLDVFEEAELWGWAFWNWNIVPGPAPNMDLITLNGDENIDTTMYYDILKRAISTS